MRPERRNCGACPLAPTRREFLRDVSLMLGVSWIAALKSVNRMHTYPIPTTDGAEIDRKNEVILVRWQNAVYAFNLSCPHQNTALKWDNRGKRFQCPKHHSRYQPDGTFIDGRATRGMDRLSIALDGSTVLVDLDGMHRQDADPAGWAAAVVHVA